MWCNVCQSDVAIEVGADHRRVTCSTCGTVLGETAVSREGSEAAPETQGERIAQARDLLDRWASSHLLDPYGPPKKPVPGPEASGTASEAAVPPDGSAAASRPEPSERVPPERMDDLLAPPPTGVRPRWDAPHASMRRPMNLHRQEEGPRDGDSADDAAGGVAESSRRAVLPTEDRRLHSTERPKHTEGPDDREVGAAGRDSLAASAAELDRLTNEILSRVSRIADQRGQQTDDIQSSESTAGDAWHERPGKSELPDSHLNQQPAAADSTPSLSNEGRVVEPAEPSGLAPVNQPGSSDDEDETSTAEPPDGALHESADPSDSHRRVPRPHAAAFTRRVDGPHEPADPHADFSLNRDEQPVEQAAEEPMDSASWFGGIGQGLAWLGILGLTGGTSLVIVGYFGGPATYAPMGWLISTIGQMLLFLGIVTLVSSGMEQTTQEVRRTVSEVSRKLDLIDGRIVRIDAAHSPGPPRPHIADRMVNATSEQRSREESARR